MYGPSADAGGRLGRGGARKPPKCNRRGPGWLGFSPGWDADALREDVEVGALDAFEQAAVDFDQSVYLEGRLRWRHQVYKRAGFIVAFMGAGCFSNGSRAMKLASLF